MFFIPRECEVEEQTLYDVERVCKHGSATGSQNYLWELTSAKILDLIKSQNSHVTHIVLQWSQLIPT